MTPTLTAAETAVIFPDSMTLRQARATYFARNGFDDRTYTETWVRLPVGPLAVFMPNLPARKEAVKVHDINHVVTGYGTDWKGEFEISAFEVGMGTGRYWFGWFLDVGGVAAGLLLYKDAVLRAFARGRRARKSIYHRIDRWDDAVLDETLGALRGELQLDDAPVPTAAERRAAWGYAALGVALHIVAPLALLGAAVAAVVALT